MTITARIVKAVVTLPILGTVSRNDKGEVIKSAERYRVHIYAAPPGWKDVRPLPELLVVGVLTGGGYTSEPFKRSQHVLVTEGRELIALMTDSDGIPLSLESLPIEIEEIQVTDPLYHQGGFVLAGDGQVFINRSFIEEAPSNRSAVYTVNMGVSLNDKKSTADKVREIVAKYLTAEAKEYEDELVEELKVLIEKESDCTRLPTIISEQIRQRLKKEMQPGGLLHWG